MTNDSLLDEPVKAKKRIKNQKILFLTLISKLALLCFVIAEYWISLMAPITYSIFKGFKILGFVILVSGIAGVIISFLKDNSENNFAKFFRYTLITTTSINSLLILFIMIRILYFLFYLR